MKNSAEWKKMLTRMTGIADEADEKISKQIEVHKSLGWDMIELRTVQGVSITKVDDATFDNIYAQMSEAGIKCAGFASAIANWARPITHPFEEDIEDLKRSIPRMKKMGTRFIRIMSYPQGEADTVFWKKEVFRRIGELIKYAEDSDIVLIHENCDGWGAQSPKHLGELMGYFSSPAFRMVFDSGNPIQHGGTKEDNRNFFLEALPYIEHFHIKDCLLNNGGFTMPGEGDCEVEELITELEKTGYKGNYSIEPHIAMVIHAGVTTSTSANQAEVYKEYGEKANNLVFSAMSKAGSI